MNVMRSRCRLHWAEMCTIKALCESWCWCPLCVVFACTSHIITSLPTASQWINLLLVTWYCRVWMWSRQNQQVAYSALCSRRWRLRVKQTSWFVWHCEHLITCDDRRWICSMMPHCNVAVSFRCVCCRAFFLTKEIILLFVCFKPFVVVVVASNYQPAKSVVCEQLKMKATVSG